MKNLHTDHTLYLEDRGDMDYVFFNLLEIWTSQAEYKVPATVVKLRQLAAALATLIASQPAPRVALEMSKETLANMTNHTFVDFHYRLSYELTMNADLLAKTGLMSKSEITAYTSAYQYTRRAIDFAEREDNDTYRAKTEQTLLKIYERVVTHLSEKARGGLKKQMAEEFVKSVRVKLNS
ncbi:MAG: hypothetical protein LBN06_05860 [Prevotellaceae bacterium]|nr:hypothetical protein [Prevotellaceae bacterium]